MRRIIRLNQSESLRIEVNPDGELDLIVEVQDLHSVTRTMADMKSALVEDGVRPVTARKITEDIYRVIDQELIGDLIKLHLGNEGELMNSKAFNPEALKIANELRNVMSPSALIAGTALKMLVLKAEANQKLKEQMAVIRAVARDADAQIKKMREETRTEIAKVDTLHEDVMTRLRAAQPELQNIEFRINLEDGTFTPVGARSLDADNNETPEKDAPEEMVVNISTMVNDLLSRLGSAR